MPEETATAPPAEETTTASADADAAEPTPSPNDWLRENLAGRVSEPAEAKAPRSEQWKEANAELRRFRRNKQEPEPESEEQPTETAQKPSEDTASAPEADEKAFERRVQAEVDRREAVRAQRTQTQRERDLLRTNPQEYARLKAQQEEQEQASGSLVTALKSLSQQFDDTTVTPLVKALDEKTQAEVLKDPGHGFDGRRTIVERAIAALKKTAYEEGLAKGKETAQKSLRKSSAFRKELLTELRDGEEEPELAPANGATRTGDWDMNDWMRQVTGRGGRSTRE